MLTANNSRIKRTISLLIAICIITFPAQAKYSGGTGEPNDPYQITTVEDLMLLGDNPEDYNKHFILTADIDLNPNLSGRKVFGRAVIAQDVNDVNLWFEGTPFTGVFDGNDHTISHLTITGGWYLGLFGKLDSGAKISNLGLEAVDVSGTGRYIGGLVGIISSLRDKPVVVTNCYSTGKVTGTQRVGGLVGESNFATIIMCCSNCEVRGERIVGGLMGLNGGSDLFFGGIVINSYSTGMISANSTVGGLVGSNGGNITASYSSARVNGTGVCAGGLVGDDYGIIFTSYSTGEVSGNRYVGGFVGKSQDQIAASYSTGTVTGDDYVGGLVGHISGSIITTSYSTGNVNGNNHVGGLVGEKYIGTVTDSFWDIETSGQTISADGTGKTTAELLDIDTFLCEGWDFVGEIHNGTCDYWQISPGDYPKLRYPVMPEGLGTGEEPYLIQDAQDLGTVWFDPHSHYRLEASVNLSGIIWPMSVVPWFDGTFDGNNNVISHLHIQGSGNLGLFGRLGPGANISDLGLEAVDVYGVAGIAGITAVGSLVGKNDRGSISTCYSNGKVNGTGSIGGLVGSNSGAISNCNSTGSISSTGWHIGGLVGSNGSNISNSYSTCTVKGGSGVGGLVGSNYEFINDGTIDASYSIGTVSGESEVGGFVGGFGGPVYDSFWDVETSGQSFSAGGTGKTTVEMHTTTTYLEAGWDFVEETVNSPNGIWKISEGLDYPRLWWEKYGSGTGEPNNPYLIYTAEQLNEMSTDPNDWDKHFKLMADINLSGYSYDKAVIAPHIGNQDLFKGIPFTGVFNGNGHTISHLTIHSSSLVSLFGLLESGAEVRDLGILDVNITGSGTEISGLVANNQGHVANCYSTGTFSGNWSVGGLVGNNLGSISNCYSISKVIGNSVVGGLVGINDGVVIHCYSNNTVDGVWLVGGLVGSGREMDVASSFWNIEISGQTTSAGGTGKTCTEMQTASTFLEAGWDFVDETANNTKDIWRILEGRDYPRLWWETVLSKKNNAMQQALAAYKTVYEFC